MSDEQLQFAISQYVDGTLPPAEVAALEQRLREDPSAQRLLEEYRRLGDLVQLALPEPEMDWDRLSKQISAAIDRDVVPAMEGEAPAAYRIGFWKPLAMAAAVLLCATVAVVLLRSKGESVNVPEQVAVNPPEVAPAPKAPGTPAAPELAMGSIQVLQTQKPSGAPVLSVQIGPAPDGRIDLADLYPEMASDYRSSISIAGDPSRMAMSDDFGVIQ